MLYPAAQKAVWAVRKTKNRLLNAFDPPVVVLIYHRVTTLPVDPQLLAVTPENFRSQMRYLKENFNLVRFEEDWSGITSPSVAVTFDDGYADNMLEALPILDEVGVPATFFVATGTVGTRREFWWDELEGLVLGEDVHSDTFQAPDGTGRVWQSATKAQRRALYEDLQPLMKRLDARTRGEWLEHLRRWAGNGASERESHRAMSLPELRYLAGNRWVTIGAHTVTHSSLAALDRAEQKWEITGSRRALESWLGREISVFSYPFGTRSDYTADTVALCKEAGFKKVAANVPGQAHKWSDRYTIPRQLVRNWDVGYFAGQMEGFWVL